MSKESQLASTCPGCGLQVVFAGERDHLPDTHSAVCPEGGFAQSAKAGKATKKGKRRGKRDA